MPEDVKCAPGQPPARPGDSVVITRSGGFGTTQGEVKLVASDKGSTRMEIVQWTPTAITAKIPSRPPGVAPFWVSVNDGAYTGPIDIRTPEGQSGQYPPTHPPTH